MQKLKQFILILLFLSFTVQCQEKDGGTFTPPEPPVMDGEVPDVLSLLTKANETFRFENQPNAISLYEEGLTNEIAVDTEVAFQEVDGFGFALTGGSAQHLAAMSESVQDELLNELFGTEGQQIGISFIRISIGSSDLDASVFSYNDLEGDEIDLAQENFSLAPDEKCLIPILKKIQAINPEIRIMATPWSAPSWMKTNKSAKGGSLIKDYFDSFALYLLKYLNEMEGKGIFINHMTVQNEPLHDGNNPSMYMSAEDQRDFIKNSLGPLFEENQIETKIVVYDHNADRPDYPITILDDPESSQYVDGSAFHLYAGQIGALSTVRNAHPDKHIYFTEQWFGAPGNFPEDLKWHIREVVIGSQRNWSRNVIEWNLSSDPDLQPHTDGGCSQCLGGITIEGDVVKRNAGYYVVAHVSKYVRPGSVRVSSTDSEDLPNVAFQTPDGKAVLLVLNNSDVTQRFNVTQGEIEFSTSLDAGSVSTYVWPIND